MSNKQFISWCEDQIAAHTKQAKANRGKEEKAKALRIWHEESIAHFTDLLNNTNK